MPGEQAGGQKPALAAVAHDLRGGLAAATAYLDLARERLASGEPVTGEDLDLVERGLDRVTKAIDTLEGLAKGAPA
jgi:signal transduction histidine kinase